MIINDSTLERVLDAGLSQGADFAEVYAENTYESRFILSDSKPTEGMVGRLYGAGIRLFYGKEVVYVYTNDLTEASLIETANAAAAAFKATSQTQRSPLVLTNYDSIHNFKTVPWDVSKDTKIGYLYRIDKAARAFNSAVNQVKGSLTETHKQVQIANSEGVHSNENRQYARTFAFAYVEGDGLKEAASHNVGALAGSDFFETVNFEELATKAAKRALQNLNADFAPAGEMPVVIDNAFGGVIFHEACGHGLETTSVAKDASVFCGKLGEKIGNDCFTAIDDGLIEKENGSSMIDDEGYATQKTTLIEKGVLKSYLVDKMGSIKTGYTPTGSGRRQNYRFAPTSRMRNTFIAAGDSSREEMIKDVDHGIYCVNLGGGSVTPGTGAYNFAVSEAFLIKNGKVDKPVKGASLIGTGIDTIKNVVKVGSELKLAPGTCGSMSGWVPVTVGQPPILVSSLTVGGRA